MQSIDVVIAQKEAQITAIKKDIASLMAVISLLSDSPNPIPPTPYPEPVPVPIITSPEEFESVRRIKLFFAKYNVSTHSINVIWATLVTVYFSNTVFHDYVNTTAISIYNTLPHWLEAFIVGAIIPLYSYLNKQTPVGLEIKLNQLRSTQVTKELRLNGKLWLNHTKTPENKNYARHDNVTQGKPMSQDPSQREML